MYGLDCFGNPSLSLLAIVLLFVTFIFGSSSIIFQRLRRIDKLLVICFLFATLISTLLCRGSIITTLNCLSLSGFHGSFNVSGFFLLLLDLALLELLKVLPDGLLEREGTVTKDFHDLWQVDRLLFQELIRQPIKVHKSWLTSWSICTYNAISSLLDSRSSLVSL